MFTSLQIRSARTKTHVLGIWQNVRRIPAALSRWDDACSRALPGLSFSGKQGETSRVDSVLCIGLGENGKLKRGDLRDIGGSIVRSLGKAKLRSVCIDLRLTIPRGSFIE